MHTSAFIHILRVFSVRSFNHCHLPFRYCRAFLHMANAPQHGTSDVRKAAGLVGFTLTSKASDEYGPRSGVLSVQGRDQIKTPHYIATSSRGAVPHVSQDMMRSHTAIKGIYTALEDCEYSTVP